MFTDIFAFFIVLLICLLKILLFENIYLCQLIDYLRKTCRCLKQIKLLYCTVYKHGLTQQSRKAPDGQVLISGTLSFDDHPKIKFHKM